MSLSDVAESMMFEEKLNKLRRKYYKERKQNKALCAENAELCKRLEEAGEILELKSEAKCTCGRKAYNLTTEIHSWHGNDENKLSILQTFVCRSCERIFNEVKEMFKTKPPQGEEVSKRVHYQDERFPWLTKCNRYFANCVERTNDLEAFKKDPNACKRCKAALKKQGLLED